MEQHNWRIPSEAAGERLDRHVATHLDIPRNRVQGWIEAGEVQVNGDPSKSSYLLRDGDEVACRIPPPPSAEIEPEAGALDILYQDEHLVFLNKPAGLVVHPGAGRREGTLVHRLLARFPQVDGVGGRGRPGIVHRLDKDTTGVLAVALTDAAYVRLSRAFSRRKVDKRYLAVVFGDPGDEEIVIDAPVGRHPSRRKEMTVHEGGRPARSRVKRLASAAGISLLEIRLETGRTHQIRVHLKHRGYPLVGDPVYGEARWKNLTGAAKSASQSFDRPALHAWRLSLLHPLSGDELSIEAPPPNDLRRLWEAATGTDFPALSPLQISSSSAT